MTSCSICIASYRRPESLGRTLDSLFAQQIDADVCVEIIVVDNDPERSAHCVVESLRSPRFPVRYLSEPRKNISLARNAGVHAATGELMLFIDDDEQADPAWMRRLLAARDRYDADIVWGKVAPRFDPAAPAWASALAMFDRPLPPEGPVDEAHGTGNVLVAASLLRGEPGPFDERYGATGGEDMHLFDRLLRKGAVAVTCPSAVVIEDVPLARTTTEWVVRRARRTGCLYARRQIELAERPLVARVRLVIVSARNVVAAAVLAALNVRRPCRRLEWRLKLASNRGRVCEAVGRPMEDGY